jgi:hypothetical protein
VNSLHTDAVGDDRLQVVLFGRVLLDLPGRSVCDCKKFRRGGICRHLSGASALLELVARLTGRHATVTTVKNPID